MSYNNSTYIGIRKQVTQHLYKFFFGIFKLFLHQKQFQTSSLETTVDQHTRGKLCERSISSKISKSKCLCNGLDRFCIISAWWRMDQAGKTIILNSIWSYIAFWQNMFSNEFIAPLFCVNGKFGMLADSI